VLADKIDWTLCPSGVYLRRHPDRIPVDRRQVAVAVNAAFRWLPSGSPKIVKEARAGTRNPF